MSQPPTAASLPHASLLHAPIGDYRWDAITGKSTWSDDFYRILGLAPGATEASLANFLAYIHPEDREMIAGSVERIQWEGQPLPHTVRLIRADGAIRHVQVGSLPELSADGRVVGVSGSLLDLTDAREVEREFQRRVFN